MPFQLRIVRFVVTARRTASAVALAAAAFVRGRLMSVQSRRLLVRTCVGAMSVVLLALLAYAQQTQIITWVGGGADSNWSTAGNWSSGTAAGGTGQAALFTNDPVGQTKLAPNLTADVTIGQLQYSATAPSYTITGTGAPILYISPAASYGGVGLTVASGAADQTITPEVYFLSTQSWDIGGTTTLTASGTIEDTATPDYGLTKNGTGTLLLPGDVRYDGPTVVNAGLLVLGFSNTSMLSAYTVNGGILRAASITATPTSVNALGSNATRNTITLAGGALELANNTGLAFGPSSRVTTVSGNTTIRSDRLTAGAGVTHSLGTLHIGAQTLSVAAGGFVNSGTAGTTFGATTLSGNATFNVVNSGSASAQLTLGAIGQSGGAQSLTKTGNGTLLLNGAGNYTGSTTLSQGTITLGVANALGSGGFTFAGGALNGNNTTDSTIGALTLTADSTLNLSPGGAAATLTFAGVSGTANGILTITGWSGVAGGLGTNDKIVFSGGTAPNADFLQHIRFDLGGGNTDFAALNANGELFPSAISTGAVVPNVVNLTQAAATTAITNAALVVGNVTTAASATVAAGSVISQNPAAGASASIGSSVTLVVSSGPPPLAPACTLTANPSSIVAGNSSSLSWTTTNAASLSINQNIGMVTPVAAGSESVSPSATTAYTATVTGPGGASTCGATLTVNQPPAITSANNATFTVGAAASFSVTATGFPGPTFSESGSLPSGVVFNSAGILSGTPAANTAGMYPILITAQNGVAPNATQSFTLTVLDAPPPLPPAAEYSFNAGSGTTAADLSGNGNNGTLMNGVAWTTAGKYGGALSFDGNNDFVSIPDAATLDLGTSGTIEAWVKLNAINRWNGIIAKGNTDSDPAMNYAIEVNSNNRLECFLGNGSTARTLTATSTVTTGTFYHVACVWNGSQLQLYINGALNTSVTQNLTPAANNSPLYIGQYGNTHRMLGIIDEVRVYGRALSQTEVQTDMNTAIAPAGPSPAVNGLNPTSAMQGAVTNVVITGSNFLSGATCSFGSGVTVNSCSFNSATQLTANVAISAGATVGPRTVAVNNPDGQSGSLASGFTVNAAPPPLAPTLNNVSPIAGQQKQTLSITLAGANFLSGAACSFGAGITVNSCTVNSATQIAANITIASGAATGLRNVTVTNPDGQAATLVSAFTVEAAPPPPTVNAAYSFNAGSGTTAADLSGNGNNGTLQNGVAWTTAGKYGRALSFDGNNDFVSIPDAATLHLGTSGTIEAWVKLNAINRWNGIIAKGNTDSDPAMNYAIEVNGNNRLECFLGNGSTARTLTATSTVTTGTFYHVACVWNGSQLQLYINGALNTSVTQNLTPAANNSPLYIGQYGNTDRMLGIIDEVRVYGRALSQTEVQTDMNTPLAP